MSIFDKILGRHEKITPLSLALLDMDACWGIEPGAAQRIVQQLNRIDMHAHQREFEARPPLPPHVVAGYGDPDNADQKPYMVQDGIAYLYISGVTSKKPTSWGEGCSTALMRRQVRLAAADGGVLGIAIIVDSPGGEVRGNDDLAADIRSAAKKKTVGVYAEDRACSCGYWLATQGSFLYANPSCWLANIGCFVAINDTSKLNGSIGVETYLATTGWFKGAGTPGTTLTDQQKAAFTKIANDCNALFMADVAAGRNIPIDTVRKLATGEVYVGKDALALGLVDRICSLDDFVAEMKRRTKLPKAQATGEGLPPPEPDDDPDLDDLLDDDPGESDPGDLSGVLADDHNQFQSLTEASEKSGASLVSTEPGKGRKDNTMNLRETLSQKLTAFGLHGMASKVIQTNSEDQDTIASALAASVNEQVTAKVDVHPLIMACRENGVISAADITALIAARTENAANLAEARTDALAAAVYAYGDKDGPKIGASVNSMDMATVKAMTARWNHEGDVMAGRGPKGEAPTRQTDAPTMDDEFKGLPNAAAPKLATTDYYANINGAKGAK